LNLTRLYGQVYLLEASVLHAGECVLWSFMGILTYDESSHCAMQHEDKATLSVHTDAVCTSTSGG